MNLTTAFYWVPHTYARRRKTNLYNVFFTLVNTPPGPLRVFQCKKNLDLAVTTVKLSGQENQLKAKKQNTEKQSELAAKHSKQNELTPRQTEKIEAAKQTLKIYGAGYVSHFKPAFV